MCPTAGAEGRVAISIAEMGARECELIDLKI
jgi:hypothetical protein